MASTRSTFIRHIFAGGWATDFGPSVDMPPDQSGSLRIPYLLQAENLIYLLNGGIRKMPGLTKIVRTGGGSYTSGRYFAARYFNADYIDLADGSGSTSSTEPAGDSPIKGIFDYWISGSGGTPSQHRVIHIGSDIMADNGDGDFNSIISGMTAGAVPVYAAMNDTLCMVNTADTPKTWDGSTAQDMAGSPPANLGWIVLHKGRLFAGGDTTFPSRLYYSARYSFDWIGGGSGTIDVDTDDGDGLIGAVPYKGELILFKGPKKGSIHRLGGSAPTGDDPFNLIPFIKGTGAAGHNCIVPYGDDIMFISPDGAVRSLQATAAFGSYAPKTLSFQIASWIREHVNFSRLRHAWAVDWSEQGYVLIALPIDGSDNPNCVLMMDYRLSTQNALGDQQEATRWSDWSDLTTQCVSIARVVDNTSNDRQLVMAGGADGFVRKMGQPARSIDGTDPINMVVKTPYFSYGSSVMEKTINSGAIGFAPKSNSPAQFEWTRDNNPKQSELVDQLGAGAVLGPADTNEFILDSSVLGGADFVESFFRLEEGGTFRTISYGLRNGVAGVDIEAHNISAGVEGAASWSLEN